MTSAVGPTADHAMLPTVERSTASRRLREYPNNLRKMLAGLPYRAGNPEGYRRIHHALRAAILNRQAITLTVLENCEVADLNGRERHWIESRGTLNGGSAGATRNSKDLKMDHVVLLGDSIFDNAAYVAGGPDVVRQLQKWSGPAWRATLLARDGDVAIDVVAHLNRLPADASWLIVSAGGNDALGHAAMLNEPAQSVAEAVDRLAGAAEQFAREYRRMIEAVVARGLPVAVCTIYDANYDELRGRLVRVGLALFNDVITRAAFERGLPLIDLRLICTGPADYANPIEPSERGGDKIATVIAKLVTVSAPVPPRSAIWTL